MAGGGGDLIRCERARHAGRRQPPCRSAGRRPAPGCPDAVGGYGSPSHRPRLAVRDLCYRRGGHRRRSEEHTSELQSRRDLVCRLLLEKKKKTHTVLTQERKKDIHISTN